MAEMVTLGNENPNKTIKIVCHYLTGCLSDPVFKSEAEKIITQSIASGGSMSSPGDITIWAEDNNMTKSGEYMLILKYLEVESC